MLSRHLQGRLSSNKLYNAKGKELRMSLARPLLDQRDKDGAFVIFGELDW